MTKMALIVLINLLFFSNVLKGEMVWAPGFDENTTLKTLDCYFCKYACKYFEMSFVLISIMDCVDILFLIISVIMQAFVL